MTPPADPTSVPPAPRGPAPIGVFDSGVGGLTVVRALRQAMPTENIVYLGDTARVPYGSKSARTVERYALACQAFLLQRDVKLVLIACNTASANALPALRAVSPVPVIGAVEPGAASAVAATRSGRVGVVGRVGVIGTLSTIRSSAYVKAIAALDDQVEVATLACPLLVPLAEEGWIDDEIATMVARRYLTELFAKSPELDVLVLGCTHYPLLAGVISRVAEELAGHAVTVIDSAQAMASAARVALRGSAVASGTPALGTPLTLVSAAATPTPPRGRLECYATDITRLDELAPRFLGEPIDRFELVDL